MKMWLFPYENECMRDRKGNLRPIGKRVKKCPECSATFENNLPWNAKFCPNCGSRNGGLENE